MVLRILKNPVYIGVLEQGRVTTPSYQVKKVVTKPREEWAVVEHCHQAIIDPFDFETIQRVLALDTRTSASGQAVDLFSGMVFCGECGAPMVKKTIPSGKRSMFIMSAPLIKTTKAAPATQCAISLYRRLCWNCSNSTSKR